MSNCGCEGDELTRAANKCWYGEGLRFTCKRCGRCCRTPGYVWVSEGEVGRIAEHLGEGKGEFARKYVREALGRLSLVELENGDCFFYGEGGCRIYPARPKQCKAFPFWPEDMRSQGAWEEVGEMCPGVGDGELYSREEIDAGGGACLAPLRTATTVRGRR